ncbi:putative alpha/beta hydrolase [Xylariaceae sp. FL0804]|nr:putative alpha/beta hydrolase [Xylariaceae sp. FL0804]
MAATQTVDVAHLGARVGYAVSNGRLDPAKPTCVMLNSMNTTAQLFRRQMTSERLTAAVNVLAIEPLGHGATTTTTKKGRGEEEEVVEHFTYWDSARCALQAMSALGVNKAFALGTSQGGWIVVRMALLAPNRILGLLPLGTSMDAETAETREKGCWNAPEIARSVLDELSPGTLTPEFVVSDAWVDSLLHLGFGSSAEGDAGEFWRKTMRDIYREDGGRRKLRATILCLADRDGLLLRLRDVRCPVHWLHGTADKVYSTQVAQEHIALFTGSKKAQLDLVEGGEHFLNASRPEPVEQALLDMVAKYSATRL